MNFTHVADLEILHGKSVLVKSTRDTRTPRTGIRGSLVVEKSTAVPGSEEVKVVIDYPDMFTAPAHQLVVPLTPEEVTGMLAGGSAGPFEIALEVDLEKEARDLMQVAPRILRKGR